MTEMFEGHGPRVNVALLAKTLDVVEEEAAKADRGEVCQWEQGEWRCGTGMCFAGWAAHLDGAQWASEDPLSDHFDDIVAEPGDHFSASQVWDDAEPGVTQVTPVSARAQRVLGLTEDESEMLFSGGNGIEDIKYVIDKILKRAAQQPA